jgi:hypothetical protein
LIYRNWPDAPDETKAIYKEFLIKVANASFDNLNQFLIFEGDKNTNLLTLDYRKSLANVSEIYEIITDKNKHEM